MTTALVRIAYIFPDMALALCGLTVGIIRLGTDRSQADRSRTDALLGLCLFGPSAVLLTEWAIHPLSLLRTVRYDQYLYWIDGLLGFQPSVLMARMLHAWRPLGIMAELDYNAMPAAMMLVFAAYLWLRPRVETLALARTLLVAVVAAVPVYMLVPASGPGYAAEVAPMGAGWAPDVITLTAPANCVPSVHMACALLVWWFAWRWRVGAVIGGVHVLLTIMATLGGGEHYAVDLVLAVPYAALVAWVCRSREVGL